jgi:glycosidase
MGLLYFADEKSNKMKKISLSFILLSLMAVSCNNSQKSPSSENEDKVVSDNPATEDIRMYELFLLDFTPEGTLNAAAKKLPEIKELGINVIWFMPPYPISQEKKKGTYGSPYASQDFYGINPDYGTKADFQAFVDAAHEMGIKVIIDMVANHTGWDNKWVTEHPEWYEKDSAGNIIAPIADWTDVASLNYDNQDLRKEMINMMCHWVRDVNIDGFRCDVAEMVPIDWWKTCIDSLKAIKPVIMLAEGADPELIDAGFQMTYAWERYNALKKVFKGDSALKYNTALIIEEAKFPANSRRMVFTTNHDETSWDATPIRLFNGLMGAQAASVASIFGPGVPLIYNGQEVGDSTILNLFEKIPVKWDLNPEMRKFYQKTLGFKANHKAFTAGSFESKDFGKDVIGYSRTHEGKTFLVMVNVRNQEVNVNTEIGSDATDLYTETQFTAAQKITLKPYQYLVLELKKS